MSFLAVPVYTLLLRLQPVNNPTVWMGYPIYVLNAFTGAFPAALLVLLVLHWVRAMTGDAQGALAVAVAFGLGALVTPFATLFFRPRDERLLILCGILRVVVRQVPHDVSAGRRPKAGHAPVCRRPCSGNRFFDTVRERLSSHFLLTAYGLLTIADKKQMLFYLFALLPSLAAFMLYNTLAFGSPFTLSYLHSPLVAALGLAHLRTPSLIGLWSITIGPRGLFILSPLHAAGHTRVRESYGAAHDLRLEFWLFAAIVAGFGTLACLY